MEEVTAPFEKAPVLPGSLKNYLDISNKMTNGNETLLERTERAES